MTELLFQTDSYLNHFSARVTDTDPEKHTVVLDRTAFYPGGGGQPYDLGSLHFRGQTAALERAQKVDGRILHRLQADAVFPEVGEEIEGILDWERRYRLMKTHTALHILCGVVFRDYGALVTGGDMEPMSGRMDFEFESLHKDLVQVIEDAVNREVQAARPIKVNILPREEAFQIPDLIRTKINLLPEGIETIRTVEIEDLDLQADGGTHVRNTSEVGTLRIVDYKSKGKINKRIYLQIQA